MRQFRLFIRKGLAVITCFFCFLQAHGQTAKIDSIDRLIRSAPTDTGRINLMIARMSLLSDLNLDSAALFGNAVIRTAAAYRYKRGEAKARQVLATIYCYAGEFEQARRQLVVAEAQSKALKDADNLGRIYNGGYGVMYGMQSKYDSARIYFDKSIPLFEGTGNKQQLANVYQNIAIGYQQTSDLKTALSYLQKSLHLLEEIKDAGGQSTVLINVGNTYQSSGDTLRSEQSFLKAIDLAKSAGLQREEMYAYSNLSTLYMDMKNAFPAYDAAMIAAKLAKGMGDRGMQSANLAKAAAGLAGQQNFQQAEGFARQAIALADASQQAYIINQTYGTLGAILNMQGKYGAAIPYLEKGIGAIESSDLYSIAFADNYKDLALCYEKTGQYEKALRAHKKGREIADSASNKENVRKITELSLNYEFDKAQQAVQLQQQQNEAAAKARQQALTAALLFTLLLVAVTFLAFRSKQRDNKIINREKRRSDDLLLNILPQEVAEELKNKGYSEAKGFDEATVLFADIKEFTKMGERLSPKELVTELDYYFRMFDEIIALFGIEKIKTIGDAYLCAGGLPVPNDTHAFDVAQAALRIQQQLLQVQQERKAAGHHFFEFRIGIHTGPVVAGIVGIKKFAYDIWGDTVNTAARMEQSSEPGKINISGETYAHIKHAFHCTYRGKMPAKHKLDQDMYFVDGAKQDQS